MGSKTNGIKYLMKNGFNVASTHALFDRFDEEMINYISKYDYTLVLDEVSEVVRVYDVSEDDLKTILDHYVSIDDKNIMHWTAANYEGRFNDCKALCDLGCLALYGNKVMLWLFPVNVFRAFKEVYLLTYLFDAQIQKSYFDLHGVTYKKVFVSGETLESYAFTHTPVTYKKPDYNSLIHICDDEKLNTIGSPETALSFNWYSKRASQEMLDTLQKNTYNFFFNKMHSKSSYNLWTTFKEWRPILAGKGYAKGFISHNKRATNEYRNRTALAYLINRYMKTGIKNFFQQNGIKINEDQYALSEMLQWIWRSAIRDGHEIWVYIPSSRMRRLLQEWLAENSGGEFATAGLPSVCQSIE